MLRYTTEKPWLLVLVLLAGSSLPFLTTAQITDSTKTMLEKVKEAIGRDDAGLVRQIIADGFDIESRDRNGRTALLLATHANAVQVAKVLIEAGADVNARDHIDDSAFLYAGAEGRLEILRMTLENGADLSSVNRYGGTALIPAAHHGHIETVRELLKTGIDIDHVNFLGWTALLETVILGDGGPVYIEITRLLIDAGADIGIADNDHVTPLQHAHSRGYAEIEALLRAAMK